MYLDSLEIGMASGVASAVTVEGLIMVKDWIIKTYCPIDVIPKVRKTDKNPLGGTFAIHWYMANRTKRSLPVYIIPRIDPNVAEVSEKPIQWMGRKDFYGLQEVTLPPHDDGEFYLNISLKRKGIQPLGVGLAPSVLGRTRRPTEIGPVQVEVI